MSRDVVFYETQFPFRGALDNMDKELVSMPMVIDDSDNTIDFPPYKHIPPNNSHVPPNPHDTNLHFEHTLDTLPS